MIAIYLPSVHFFQLDLTDTIWTLEYENIARHIASYVFFSAGMYAKGFAKNELSAYNMFHTFSNTALLL